MTTTPHSPATQLSPPTSLSCASCDRRFASGDGHDTCPECGPLLGTLAFEYPGATRDALEASIVRSESGSESSLWRYAPLLPVEPPEAEIARTVGWTPLVRADRLANTIGVARLRIKDETAGPTGSLKDRASAVALTDALSSALGRGVGVTAVASTGSAAHSWCAMTAATTMDTYIFVSASTPADRVERFRFYGATVILVEGTYDDAFDLCAEAVAEFGWHTRSSAVNPHMAEGKKTTAFEICEQLGWRSPDVVLVPVGDGTIYQSLWKGFSELHAIGMIDSLPRLIGVQAAGCAPLAEAWRNGLDRAVEVTPDTLASSISVGLPRDQVRALRAAKAPGNAIIAVSDDAMLEAMAELASTTGVLAEPAASAPLAALRAMRASGEFGRDAEAVLVVTGSGMKDALPEGAMDQRPDSIVRVRPRLDDLAEALGSR